MTDSICKTCRPSDRALRQAVEPRKPARFRLGRRASFWVSAGVVAHTLWTSAAPAMTYRLYAEAWGLSHTTLMAIFAIYPLIVVVVLTVFGDLSDHIGRRPALLLGLAASLAGVVAFALAHDVRWLFAGRALMGIGVGLSASSSTAAMVDYSAPGQSQRAASVATAAQAAGFSIALLLGGVLTEYAPDPMHLPFWLLSAVLAGLLLATWFLPDAKAATSEATTSAAPWRPRLPAVPRDLRPTFALASVAVLTAYTHGVMVLSLGGQVAHDLVGSANALVNGAVLSSFALTSGVVGVAARRLRSRTAVATGAIASAASMGLLPLAVAWHHLPLFLGAITLAGAGYSLLFLGGLDMTNRATAARHRGGVLSALYLLAYLAMGTVALVLGAVATSRGLGVAVGLGAGVVAALSLAVLVLGAGGRVRRNAEAPTPVSP